MQVSFHLPLHRFLALTVQRLCTFESGEATIVAFASALAPLSISRVVRSADASDSAWGAACDALERTMPERLQRGAGSSRGRGALRAAAASPVSAASGHGADPVHLGLAAASETPGFSLETSAESPTSGGSSLIQRLVILTIMLTASCVTAQDRGKPLHHNDAFGGP